MLYLLAAHAITALAAPALVAWLGRRAYLVLALAPASAAVWALAHTSAVLSGAGPVEVVPWVPGLSLELAFRLDTLSWFMVLLVGGVGALVLVYSSAYFSSSAGGLGRFGGVLVGFAGAMLGLVASDDLLLLYVFWELTTVFSYLLIGHHADRKASRRAAMQAIILTTAGGLAMLVGLVLLGHAAGTYRLSEVLASPPGGTVATVAVACLLAGAITKSALIPFHFWLPAAMAAPTPVSAYLHAAAMVKAGVYLVARFAPAYADLTVWRVVVLTLGCGTLLLGGYRALRQHDLKLVLAFGTVSQLGLIVLLVGYGTQATALAGVALLGAHAMFKAALFLVVGVVDAATGTRDLRRLSGVGRALPVTATAGLLASASMMGLPPFAGFVAKEAALDALLHDDGGWTATVVLVAIAVGSALTVAYGLRFLWGAFAAKPHPPAATGATGGTGADDEPAGFAPVSRPSFVLVAPAVVLAVLGLVAALVPAAGERLLLPYAATLPRGEPGHLVLWAGVTPALGITVAVVVAGVLLFVARSAVERFQAAVHVGPEADRTYRRSMRRLDDLAADVTALTQRGSLPFYLSAILTVLVALAGTAVVTGTRLPTEVVWGESLLQGVAAALVVVSAVLAANARRRLKSVILLGACGYGIAVLFLLHGAPDLALTQVLVETITLVVFVLVLRRLPPYFSDRPLARSRWLRLALAITVGATVGALALVAPGARRHLPQSVPFPEEAYAFGGGKNIVNVVLVDIRAWDTMGEIAVLLVAATGVASLLFLSRRSGDLHRLGEVDQSGDARVWGGGADPGAALRRPAVPGARAGLPSSHLGAASVGMASRRARAWLRAEQTLAPQRRSVILEVVTRLLFHTMVVVALYLLFAGHNSPGGGFAAGLVVGVALIVRYLAGGRYELGEAAPVHPGLLLGSGLFLSAGVGLVALLAGGEVLQSTIVDLEVPVLGTIHLVTSLFFDVGVFLVVVGLVLDVLRSLGAEIDRHGEQDGGDAAGSEHGVRRALPSEPVEPAAPTGTRAPSLEPEEVS